MVTFSLSFVVEEILAMVDSLLSDETIRASNLGDQLQRLVRLLTSSAIRVLLPDPHDPQIQSYILSSSLIKVTEVAYQAQDVLDDLAYHLFRSKVTISENLNFIGKFAKKFRILNQLLPEFDETLIGVSRKFRFRRFDDCDLDQVADNFHYHNCPLVVGREADASKIVKLLTRSTHERVLTVVPIVGMDGLGKTCLARLVYQKLMRLNLFDVKMWVCVSHKCDEQKVLADILRSSKRFLLVLDDVCEHVCGWWDDFRNRLLEICTDNGNVVLVTTRSEEVASVVETSFEHRHTLDILSDDECWFILKEMAFRNATTQVQSNFEAIGREIAKNCRGVPLVAKVLGGTLRFDCNEATWLEIRDSYLLKEKNNEEYMESVLKFGFDHLPSSLKPCFAFCSIFPKGFLFIKEDLIQMWMAERLVDSCYTGNVYFHTLLAKSFFQEAEIDDGGNVTKCKMHSLVHNLALSLENSEMSIRCLYADFQSIRTSDVLPEHEASYLTTIILNGAPFQRSWNPKCLRALYLNDVDMEKLPPSVHKLKHIRYLHVSNAKLRSLSISIAEIFTLQVLTLSSCSCEQLPFLGHLPYLNFLKIRVKCIGNESYEGNNSEQHQLTLFPALKSLSLCWMENLTSWSPPSYGYKVVVFPELEILSIQSCAKLTGFPMRDLSKLVKIELKDCEELRFIFDEKKSFPSITCLSIVGCPKLTHLRNWLLSTKSYKEFRVRRCEWLKFIPENLGMQSSLISLQIFCCKSLGVFSEEILPKFTQLKRLSIGAFSENLDDFLYLNQIKYLCLEELEIWGSDVFGRKMSALPNQLQQLASLQSLKINGFTTMEALPRWLGDLQSLRTITLNYCWHLEYQPTAAIIQFVPNLSHVCISCCPALEEHKSQWMELSGTTKIRILFP